jgi:hypothetical protein
MHNLSELKDLFLEKGHKIKEYMGWYLIIGKDRYTMANDVIYLNKQPISKKELIAKIKKPPVVEELTPEKPNKAKKITKKKK